MWSRFRRSSRSPGDSSRCLTRRAMLATHFGRCCPSRAVIFTPGRQASLRDPQRPERITQSRRADVPLEIDAGEALDCQHHLQNACPGHGSDDVVRFREIFYLHAQHDLNMCHGHIINIDVVTNAGSVGRWIVTAKNLWISARGERSKTLGIRLFSPRSASRE